MGYIKRTILFYATRWLMQRRWGRRLLFVWAMRAMRSRVRQFIRDLAAISRAQTSRRLGLEEALN